RHARRVDSGTSAALRRPSGTPQVRRRTRIHGLPSLGPMMNTPATLKSLAPNPSRHDDRYARVIVASKRARWDLETDVLRGRRFDPSQSFLPDGLSLVSKLGFLSPEERRFASQVQGRTYANMFGFIERLVNAKVLQLAQRHLFGDQVALEALIR